MREPCVDQRADLRYAAIRTVATIPELPTLIPQLHSELVGWLRLRAMSPAGHFFVRYLVINLEATLDLEMGWPVDLPVVGDERVSSGVLPAGRYASLVHHGDGTGLPDAHRKLIEWTREQRAALDSWPMGLGEGFASRYVTYLYDPVDNPDPTSWQTEIAIRLADE